MVENRLVRYFLPMQHVMDHGLRFGDGRAHTYVLVLNSSGSSTAYRTDKKSMCVVKSFP